MKTHRRHLLRLGAAVCLVGAAAFAAAQEPAYPTRPVTVVVPFPPGGVVDIIGRLVADKLASSLNQPFVVQNKAGAGGTIGAAQVARSAPDGYTLLLGGSATHVFGPVLYSNPGYEPVKDFAPIGQVSSGPLMVVVGSRASVQTLAELIALLKQRGSKANYGSNGSGTFPHLAGELFKLDNDLRTVHVPYSGGAAALTALLSGEVEMSINHIPVVQAMVRSGKLKALATAGASRSAAFPELPTLQEAGVADFEANAWFGFFAPAGTPAPIVARLSAALEAVLKDDAVRTRLLSTGDEASFKGPAALGKYIESETARWTKVIKTSNIVVN